MYVWGRLRVASLLLCCHMGNLEKCSSVMIVTSVTHRPSTSILCLGLQEWVLRTARTRRDSLSAWEKTTPPSLTGKGERIARRRRLDTVPGVRWKWFGGAGSECRTRARLTLTGAVSRMVPQERPRDPRAQRTGERRRSARRGGQSSRKGLPPGGGTRLSDGKVRSANGGRRGRHLRQSRGERR